MSTFTLNQNFDGQTDAAPVTTATSDASGDGFSTVTIPGTLALTYSAEQRAHGNRSMKVAGTDTTGQYGYAQWNVTGAPMTFAFRGYLYLTGLPSATTPVVQVVLGTTSKNLVSVSTTGQLGFADMNGTLYWSTFTAALNLWYRVEAVVTIDPTAGSVLFKAYSLDSSTSVVSLNPTNINMGSTGLSAIRFGKESTPPLVAPYYVDDLAVSDQSTLIGPYVASAPTVVAGANVSGTTVTLQATATTFDGATPTYAWTQTAGTTVTLSDATVASPTFTAPSTGTYSFSVTVTDSVGATATASTTATVAASANTPTATLAMYHDVFVIDATASTPAFSGALSYSISPSTGLTALGNGRWVGTMPNSATPYTITVTEAGNANTATASVTVPGTAAGTGIHILLATADQGSGGTFA